MSDIKNKQERRFMRHARVRKKVNGTTEMPRLVVFKSSKHVYAQVVNDESRKTLLGVSTLSPEIRETVASMPKMQAAVEVGKLMVKKLQESKIEKVVFDRNGYPYHGVVKQLAEAVREAQLLS